MAPTGKKAESPNKSAAVALLAATAPSAENDENDALANLKRPPQKKRNPGKKWDGRLAGMSLKEYRERKWSVDACYAKVERRGPSFSMRPSLSYGGLLGGKKNDNFTVGDVFRSFSATLPTAPSFSMGVTSFNPPRDRSQGPAEYPIKSTMDPGIHPTCPKNRGARFGSEVLEPRDPPGPAPGNYDADAIDNSSTIKKPPNFTIQGREAWRAPTTAPGPGVGEYDYTKAMRTGKLTPICWNAQGKTEPLKIPLGQRQYSTPAPDHYHGPGAGAKSNPMKLTAPQWKFGGEPRGLRV